MGGATCITAGWSTTEQHGGTGKGRLLYPLRFHMSTFMIKCLCMQANCRAALHVASMKGHVALVKALVDAGADVNAANVRSQDTIMILRGQRFRLCPPQQGGWVGARCVDACCTVCVGWLCCSGAGQVDGRTPIMPASRGGHLVVVAALVSRGANVSARAVRRE
jgi:hypothetical protein